MRVSKVAKREGTWVGTYDGELVPTPGKRRERSARFDFVIVGHDFRSIVSISAVLDLSYVKDTLGV